MHHVLATEQILTALAPQTGSQPQAPLLGCAGFQEGFMRFCIRQVGQQYAVIDRSTGQCRYIGSLDGARQVQAQLARAAS